MPVLLPRRAPLAAALALALILFPLMAHPARAADVETPDDGRERKPRHLASVEVVGQSAEGYAAERTRTATKTDTDLRDVPQAVTVITQELIEDQAMQGVADVVRYVPGMGIAQGEGNRDTPIFRGNGSTADLFIDGMRDDVQYFRDLYNIERVEALKGPNAMIFGRGGSGGVLNRVSKAADWNTVREINLQLGSWDKRRLTADIGQAINEDAAFRVTALAEENQSFRDGYEARRWGINPTFAWQAGDNTTITLGAEHFRDERTADRGVPSYLGRPLEGDPSTFFGDPDRSPAWAEVNAFTALIDHTFGNGATLRNRTRLADYDKFYQNVFPGAVSADGTTVSVSAYNNATQRRNYFNQTDLVFELGSGAVRHTLLAGAELGRQETDNLRHTGYFAADGCPATGNTTYCGLPVTHPRYTGPLTFAQSATDADNRGIATVAALYVQDQIEFSPRWQAVLGLRYDHFRVELHNHRNGSDIAATDNLVSPRVGLVFKPVKDLSLYASYSLAYLPRSGEQLASLSASNASLEPEEFRNLELGAKWDLRPGLMATAAIYRLDRSNVAVVDPDDSTRLILLDGNSQRVQGLELEISGQVNDRWRLIGGYAYQDGEITRDIQTSASASSLIPKGTVLAQLPRHTFSLWNRVDFNDQWGAGLGVIHRGDMFATTSNHVTLPGYTRVDAAVYYAVNDTVQLQLNIENLFDRDYFASAHSDNNISPGSPRAFNLGLHLSF